MVLGTLSDKLDENDIITIDKDPAFSDSDMSQGEIQYLSDDPIPENREEWEEEEEDGWISSLRLIGDSHLTTNDHGSIRMTFEE